MKTVSKCNRSGVTKQVYWLLTWLLLLMMILPPGAPAAFMANHDAPSSAWQGESAGTTNTQHLVYLPLVIRRYIPSPGDDLIVSWAESLEGGGRTILLQWNPLEEAAAQATVLAGDARYLIYRRIEGAPTWELLGEVRAAANVTQMKSLLGADLTRQLQWDLRERHTDPQLTELQLFNTLMHKESLGRVFSKYYYEVALVLGRAYLDLTAPRSTRLQYRIEQVGGSSRPYMPVNIPAEPDPLPLPTNLRATWYGPATLGLRPSNRPANAEERYDWMGAARYRAWDGTVYLMWDLPAQPDTAAPETDSMRAQGYLVYRAAPGSPNWEVVNAQKERCQFTDPELQTRYCTIMIGASGQPTTTSTVEDPEFFFREDLREVYTQPADIYRAWRYKVCPVDLKYQIGPCTAPLTVTPRELLPPAPVQHIEVTITEDPARVHLTWVYSDTAELSPPLRFYVTRSPTYTASLDTWEPLYPAGSSNPYIQTAITTPLTMTIVDAPPLNQPHWYRIQVRDNAGNWSAPSVPVAGALYNREPPTLVQPEYDDICANNPETLVLENLDPAVVEIVIHRRLGREGSWQIIARVPTVNGAAVIEDLYNPPYAMDVYYRYEAVDRHGNVSDFVHYCTQLTPLAAPPPDASSAITCPDGRCRLDVWVEDPETAHPAWEESEFEIRLPGEEGEPVIITGTLAGGSFTLPNVNPGTWYDVEVSGPGGLVRTLGRWVNNFLDTNRHLTDLGPLSNAWWMTDTVTGKHYVQIPILHDPDPKPPPPAPPMAVFRRVPGGNWMQVTPITITTYTLEDHSDPSPFQNYEYVVVAFSPNTYEMLGVWQPFTLNALKTQVVQLDAPITAIPRIPGTCGYDSYTPEQVEMPEVIGLYNGWSIEVDFYFIAHYPPDPSCPVGMHYPDSDHLFGTGWLTNGTESWQLSLYDIGIDYSTGVHNRGRIVGTLDHTVSGADILTATFGKIEFRATSATAEVTLTLPPTIRLHDSSARVRSRSVFGRFTGVRPNFQFNRRDLSDAFYWVDENLPWQLHGASTLRYNRVDLLGPVVTQDRLGYTPPDISGALAPPDNNLGYLRVPYTNDGSVTITPRGLNGAFMTSEAIHYSTGQPAAFIISATGAVVVIQNSQITGGELRGASAYLDYWRRGTHRDYMASGKDCVGFELSDPRWFSLCMDSVGPLESTRVTLVPWPANNPPPMPIGHGGRVIANVANYQLIQWSSFTPNTSQATLYIADASFANAPTDWAPMPAENAWRRRDLEVGNLDPGLNIIAEARSLQYTCYTPSLFQDASMDLHVRRGGVSEFLGIYEGPNPTQRVNDKNYQERVFTFEGVFIDNSVIYDPPLNFHTQLYLPYPSDAAYDLQVHYVHPVTTCPESGDIRSPAPKQHQYWNFWETSSQWRYTEDVERYGDAFGQDTVFSLRGEAPINGLYADPPDRDPVILPAITEWLPSGDVGDVFAWSPTATQPPEYRIGGLYFAFSKVELSRYYSDPRHTHSLPSTLGTAMNDNFAELPAEMLDEEGNLTPQSLKNCTVRFPVGCGLVLLDGNAAVDYFGEPRRSAAAGAALNQLSPFLPLDEAVGQFPIASNALITTTTQGQPGLTDSRLVTMTRYLMTQRTTLPWMWPVFNHLVEQQLPLDLPVKFMGSARGVVVAAVARNALLFDEMELFHGDVGAVVTINWSGANPEQKLGIYVGYPASQAAFRALAMNRPDWRGGIRSFDRWAHVSADVTAWAEKFGYAVLPGPRNDPADLAQALWEAHWCTGGWTGNTCNNPRPFDHAYAIVMPYLKTQANLVYNTYGMTGLTSGPELQDINAYLRNGSAEILFVPAGLSLRIESLQGGAGIRFDTGVGKVFLEANWIAIRLTRDGELGFSGATYLNLVGDWGTDGYLYGLASYASEDKWRVEGSLELDTLGLSGIAGLDVSAAFGVGKVSGQDFAYVGLITDLYFLDYSLAAVVLFGSLDKDSTLLRTAGYGEVLDVLGDASPYDGWYVRAAGEFPLMDYASCMMRTNVGIGVRLWYFMGDTKIYGGDLSGWVYAQVACVLSARGNLTLGYARLDEGGTQYNRTCAANQCDCYGGEFWVAVGIGWCEPKTWNRWTNKGSNWWGDSWCWTFGTKVDISYLDPPGTWDASYKMQYE